MISLCTKWMNHKDKLDFFVHVFFSMRHFLVLSIHFVHLYSISTLNMMSILEHYHAVKKPKKIKLSMIELLKTIFPLQIVN